MMRSSFGTFDRNAKLRELDPMHARTAFLCFLLAVPMTACGSSSTAINPAPVPADAAAPGNDAGVEADVAVDASDASSDAAPVSNRTMVYNPLFGDAHAQNLFIDPNFSVRQPGLGNWMVQTNDMSQSGPTYAGSLMSDSPAGIALPVAHLADAANSISHYQLDMVAQVPGGPAPYRLRVWISTLDATASVQLTGITAGLLVSLNGTIQQIKEDPQSARVIAGRTWHRFDGTLTQDLELGGFVVFDFAASQNTWLLQAPEFIPTAIDPSSATRAASHSLQATTRPMTTHEKELVDRYRHQPFVSVPASHAAISDRPRGSLRW